MSVYTFSSQVDSIDIDKNNENLVLGLSNLEGNIWDGSLVQININSGEQISQCYSNYGITCVKYLNRNHKSEFNSIISGGDDGNINIYDSNLNVLNVLIAHDDIVSSIQLSYIENNYFYSSSWDGCINLFDVEALQCLNSITAHSGMINSIDSSPLNPALLASVGFDGFLRLWDIRSLNESKFINILPIKEPGSTVNVSRFNENELFVGSDTGKLLIYDLRCINENNLVQEYNPHKLRIRKILSSSKSEMFLSCSDDKDIVVHNRTTRNFEEVNRISIHNDYVSDLAWIQTEDDRSIIFSTSTDKTLQKSVI